MGGGSGWLAAAVGAAAMSLAFPVPTPDPTSTSTPTPTPTSTSTPSTPAPAYGREPAVTLSALERQAVEIATGALSRRAPPRVSGALVLAARELARVAASGAPEPLARRRIRAAMASGFAADPAPAAALVRAEPEDVPVAAGAARLPRASATHVGVGAFEQGGFVHLVILASERRARLDPFPRGVAVGARHALSGSLAPGLLRPRVFVTLPSGRVREVEARGARDFRAEIAFDAAGRYTVEVIGEGGAGPEVVALLAVSAGGAPVAPPAELPPAADARRPGDAVESTGDPTRADDSAEVAAVLRAVNRARGEQRLPALAPAADLDGVARRHSLAMARHGRVAHVLPGSGDVGDRLRTARIPYRRAYENVARGGDALDAHEAIEESPAHLANLLRPDATRVGIGIARAPLPSGDAVVYLTEILVAPADEVRESRLTPEARVREALWAERAGAGAAPLLSDAALDALAREAAREMQRRDDTDPGTLGDRALALRRRLAAVDVFVASAPSEAVRSTNVRDRRFRRVGVGVATGDSRRFGAGRLWIAVVYTD
jgi:uncharacterized protein YkwD